MMDKRSLVNQLRKVERKLKPDGDVHGSFIAMHELLTLFYTYLKEFKEDMDKQIKKVEVAVKKDHKKDAVKDIVKLKKMDKKQDAKVAKCDSKMKMPTAKMKKK
jgi:hypothetical protein